MLCVVCEKVELTGRQTKFCSGECKGKDGNVRWQNYEAQKARGARRKRQAVEQFGGACAECGYSKNLAALCFHHEGGKDFGLDLRQFSNRSMEALQIELAKCVLLCNNCHMERHHLDLAL